MSNEIKFKKSLSRRNKPILIVNDSYIFNFHVHNKKNQTDKYICKEYKTKYACPAYIYLKNDKIEKANVEHNHNINHQKILLEEAKIKLKNEIKNAVDPFSINIQKMVKSFSQDKGIRAPSFNTIKNCLYKEINKVLPDDIVNLEMAPEESIYYNTLKGENFVIYKDADLLVLQSPGLAKIHLKFGTILFCDATFFVCPSFSYQIFITRVYSSNTSSYYTTSFSIMNKKQEKDYFKIFKILDENIKKYLDIGEIYCVEEIHTDLELAIGQACKKLYPNLKIKFCIWHLLRSLEINKNKICFNEVKDNDHIFVLYKILTNLYICDPSYVIPVFKLICKKNTNENFKIFLKYFENQYLKKIDLNSWNYNSDLTHITNNSCESYNCKLKKLFKTKPSFFKLLYELRLEENDIVTTYEKRKSGLIGNEIRRNSIILKKISILEKIKDDIIKLPCASEDDKTKITEHWFNGINIFGKNFYY